MNLRLLVQTSIFIALITVGARIQIPLPIYDYYTLQFTFVLLAGAMLPIRYAFMATVTYVVLGLIGIPVFAGGGGLDYFLRPSFGYLLAFIVTATTVAYLFTKYKPTKIWQYYSINTVGIVLTYTLGLLYKAMIVNYYLNKALSFKIIFVSALAFDIPADFVMILFLSFFEGKILKVLRVARR